MATIIRFQQILMGIFLVSVSSSLYSASKQDFLPDNSKVEVIAPEPEYANFQLRNAASNRILTEDTTASLESDKKILDKRGSIYSVSGIGLGFTGGQTGILLEPKFSTNLGLDISLGAGNFFLYPSADFLAFRYNQQIDDINYLYSTQKSRATYKIFTLSIGYRKTLGKLSIYQFVGFGGGIVAEPRISVSEKTQETVSGSRKSSTWSARGGLGLDYRIGQFVFFTEGAHLHNFKSLQERKILVFPVYIGLKSNISNLFKSNN